MTECEWVAPLEAALAAVREAGESMKTPRPEKLDESAQWLEAACREMAGMRDRLPGNAASAPALAAAGNLRRAVAQTARLLEGAMEFHSRWVLLKGSLAGGYDRTGRAADFVAPARTFLQA